MQKKRILSWLMTAALALSLVPATALAADTTGGDLYVLMNIPYADFYQAELATGNSVKVDAVTSATLAKTRTGSLVGGSYHVDAKGSDITGITFPVKVKDKSALASYKQVTDTDSVTIEVTNRGQTSSTTYAGKDALFENDSYAYYVLEETPSYYKELTVENGEVSFGKVVGTTTTSSAKAELSTTSSYGDYQITIDESFPVTANDTIYAVILSTKEGSSYGLRHLENIWRGTSLAFSTGFTTQVHGSPTASDHYKAIMGQTINQITYYTAKGIYTLSTDLYVPVKTQTDFAVADADISAGTAAVTQAGTMYNTYTCSDKGITYASGSLQWDANQVQPGTYTLTASDSTGEYAPVTTTFTLSTKTAVAKYDASAKAVVKADNSSDSALANYLKNLSSVKVDGKDYAASGRGAVSIIGQDGALNLNAASGETYLFGKGTHTVEVTSVGYPALSFQVTVAAGDSKAAPIEIDSAEKLAKIGDNLSACYQLTADIDLGNTTWTPIGAFVPAGTEGEDAETPNPAYAFSGTFDGNGKTISNLTVSSDMIAGLFGCVAGGTIQDLTVENATVTGSCMVGAVVGYAYDTVVENVALKASGSQSNTVTCIVSPSMGTAPNMVAGIVGAGMDSTLTNCTVENTTLTANGLEKAATWGDNVHDIGLVGGGLENCTLTGCSASNSTVTINGVYAYGIGGLAGCAMTADRVEDCSVNKVTINVTGDSAYLVGGLLGYTGRDGGETTQLTNCDASGVTLTVGDNASRIGGLVGGGFYLEIYKDYFPVPTSYEVDAESSVTNSVITAGSGSTYLGAVAGYVDAGSKVSATTQGVQVPTTITFTDVAADAYYANAVQWAVEQGVTNGTSATKFSPNASCTRAQVVTFLWRAMGSPEPTGTSTTFSDVAAGTYYTKAVQWAVEQGITNGTSATKFSPEQTVTRGQVVTFLWRLADQPAASGSTFTDVAANAYYADAVQWAVEQEITNGTSTTKFSPESACTRGQIVTFLYRDLA